MSALYPGPLADRDDVEHVRRQLPPLGGPEKADARFIAAVESWDYRAGGLILLGPSGSGKSTAALHLVNRALSQFTWAYSTMWVLAADLIESEELVARAKTAKLLILDDVGKDVGRGVKHAHRLFRVLDHRHIRTPTVITSGLSRDDLRDTFEGATRRRMNEYKGAPIRGVDIHLPTGKPAHERVQAPGRPPSDQAEQSRRHGEREA